MTIANTADEALSHPDAGPRPRPPRVLLATSFYFPHTGGLTTHVRLLAKCLAVAEGDIVNFWTAVGGKSSVKGRGLLEVERAVRQSLRIETETIVARRLVPVFIRSDAQVVHCHDVMAAMAALRARAKSRRSFKVVVTIHGPHSRHLVEGGARPDHPDVRTVIRIESEVWKGVDAIIPVDKLQGAIAVEQGADPAKLTVIPNAVDVGELDHLAGVLPLARREGRPWVLVARRLVPKNGVENAIRAVALMRPRPRLLLAGNGPEEPRLRALAAELGVAGDVMFLGPLEHNLLIPLTAAVDAAVIPSIPVAGVIEATSISAIEAMALRRPVVASGIGGLRELIRNGESGLLVEPGEPARLAEALERVFASPEAAARLGEAARRTVFERFSVGVWFDAIRGVYHRALAGT